MEAGTAVENCAGTGQGLEISPLSRRAGNAFMTRGRPRGVVFQPLAGICCPPERTDTVIWLEGERQAGRFARWRFIRLAFHRGDSTLTYRPGIGSGASITRDESAVCEAALYFRRGKHEGKWHALGESNPSFQNENLTS
jgi:hypothetical protein